MPDRTRLRIGDRILLLRVPQGDLDQREREIREGAEFAGWTADTLERILAQDPVVTISSIDEYGYPWFEYELKSANGKTEYHSIAIMEDESWRLGPSP
jgi:hypothetical protein